MANLLENISYIDGWTELSNSGSFHGNGEITSDFVEIDGQPFLLSFSGTVTESPVGENYFWFSYIMYDENRRYISSPAGSHCTDITNAVSITEKIMPGKNVKYVRISYRSFGNIKAKLEICNSKSNACPVFNDFSIGDTKKTLKTDETKSDIDFKISKDICLNFSVGWTAPTKKSDHIIYITSASYNRKALAQITETQIREYQEAEL